LVVVKNPDADGAVFVLAVQSMPMPPPNSAAELLAYTLEGAEHKLADFKIEEPVHATTVSGRHAAEVTSSFIHTKGKKSVPIRSAARSRGTKQQLPRHGRRRESPAQ